MAAAGLRTALAQLNSHFKYLRIQQKISMNKLKTEKR